MLALLLLIVTSVVAHENAQCFPDNTQDAESGVSRICYTDATNKYSTPLINDEAFMKGMTKLNRERLPERVVHAKGSGAYGYFEVTHDISHICNADFLKEVGKKTPVAVRFATGVTERGSSDLGRDTRAMSVKFYTDEGNFDLLGSAKPMFLYKDPLRFTTIIHAAKRRPDSNLFDQNTYWDAISLLPESLNFFLRLYSDEGIPASFRNMAGFAIHTFQVVNKHGDYHFVRFHCIPDDGEKTLTTEEAMTLGAADPDYAIRDLYEKINEGNYPSWTLSVQILKMADVKEHGVSRVFDTTRELPVDKFPLHQVGKIVLNKNAKDFQNEIEKLAFCPCNLVPGIVGSPDKLFEARAQLYKDAQLYRLGKNHNKIPVNCPIHTIYTYNRDGMPPLGSNHGNATNYYPNSFGGPQPYDKERNSNKTCKGQGLIKIKENPFADNFDQAAVYYKGLNDARRTILIENLKAPLITVEPFIQKRLLNLFTSIDSDLANRFAEALGITLP